MNVGSASILYLLAIIGYFSVSIFTTWILSFKVAPTSLSIGTMNWHGPHLPHEHYILIKRIKPIRKANISVILKVYLFQHQTWKIVEEKTRLTRLHKSQQEQAYQSSRADPRTSRMSASSLQSELIMKLALINLIKEETFET